MTKRKILFFIAGPVPNAAALALCDNLTNSRSIVCFRNSLAVRDGDAVERCDAITGGKVIPAIYLAKSASYTPPQVIDLEQPELPLAEAPAVAASPMAAVSSVAPEPVIPPPPPAVAPLAATASVSEIKAALTARGISFNKSANKAALLALHNAGL